MADSPSPVPESGLTGTADDLDALEVMAQNADPNDWRMFLVGHLVSRLKDAEASVPCVEDGVETNPFGVCHRIGPLTEEDYTDAIADLRNAREQFLSKRRGEGASGCAVCGDGGHTEESCHHNSLLLARRWASSTSVWKCYHCGFIATNDDEAKEHFGRGDTDEPSCLLARAESAEASARSARAEALEEARKDNDKAWYQVRQSLGILAEMDHDDPLWVDQATIAEALRVASALSAFPAPKIFSHGSDAVVFTWGSAVYLTISGNAASLFVSPAIRSLKTAPKGDGEGK